VHLLEVALGRLHERDRVLGVALGLIEARDLTLQLLADGESGRVVSRTVDAVARAEALHRLGELLARPDEVAMRIERLDVGVDSQ
jgi:hypothetical protein